MEDDPTHWPMVIVTILFVLVIFVVPVVMVFWGYRKFQRAAKSRVDPLIARLAVIAGVVTPNPVALYAIYGLVIMSVEYTPTAYLTTQNAEEVEELAKRLRSFSYRWGFLAHGGLFVPLIVWWNYRKVMPTIESFRRSH